MNQVDLELRGQLSILVEALEDAALRLRHLHGVRLEGVPGTLDFAADLQKIYSALAAVKEKK